MINLDPSTWSIRPGRAYPPGATVRDSGVRFALLSRHASRVWLALWDRMDATSPVHEIEYNPDQHRVGDVWSIFVQGLHPGTLYTFRVEGPFDPEKGHRYDPEKHLLDPYAKMVVGNVSEGKGKCVVVEEDEDWTDDVKPRTPMSKTIIYETHVRGLTIHGSAGVAAKGTYQGLIEKIPYFQELGITAIELLPIQELGEISLGRCSVVTGEELTNYWGYNTIGFFAPAGRYAANPGAQIEEFRAMVAALHKAGIEVILDVVFNHTAEGNADGPTLCFKGIDNPIYYLLDKDGKYLNFSGCGNTMNCNHPIVRNFILDCLRYWVMVMHVDGFRFDLASILGRDRKGHIAQNAPLIEQIAEDPILRDAKLIAEAWDAGGAYQVGSFGDIRWAEWNGRYRDDVRSYWRDDPKVKGSFATRISGSSDLYEYGGRTPQHSINFVTAHDGFTLRDLVSYNEKHNEANGENNRDGSDYNISWNCGHEGETDDPAINTLRLRMQKNYLATHFLSIGVPMLCGGDEFGRTQQGNNNAYCQDSPISWYDWALLEKNQELFQFCKGIIQFRKENPVFGRADYFRGTPTVMDGDPDIIWFDEDGHTPKWDSPLSRLGMWINPMENDSSAIYVMFNPSGSSVRFKLPKSGSWRLRVDTAAPPPGDILPAADATQVSDYRQIPVEARSLVVLTSSVRERLKN